MAEINKKILYEIIQKVNKNRKKIKQKEILSMYKEKKSFECSTSNFSNILYKNNYRIFNGYYINSVDFMRFLKKNHEPEKAKEKQLLYSFAIEKCHIAKYLMSTLSETSLSETSLSETSLSETSLYRVYIVLYEECKSEIICITT